MSDAGGPVVVWVWSVSVPGPESDVRDVAGSLGRAQAAAEECLKSGGGLAVVESAAVSRDPGTGRKAFAGTGRRCTARLVGGQARWTVLERTRS